MARLAAFLLVTRSARIAADGAWVTQANLRTDGVMDDPRTREPAATCLATGKQLYPGGIPRGSEPYWPLWLS
jgi:hypothetical protein